MAATMMAHCLTPRQKREQGFMDLSFTPDQDALREATIRLYGKESHPERVRALIVVDSSSAVGLPLSVENLVMRARSIEVTLKGGVQAGGDTDIQAGATLSVRVESK